MSRRQGLRQRVRKLRLTSGLCMTTLPSTIAFSAIATSQKRCGASATLGKLCYDKEICSADCWPSICICFYG